MALLCLFLGFLLNALTNAQRQGWTSDPILAQFLIATLAAAGFVWWEIRTAKPILGLRLFANLPFWGRNKNCSKSYAKGEQIMNIMRHA